MCRGRAVLLIAALAAYLGRCIEKDLYLGIGKHHGADIPSFHDNAAAGA
jgi:hypothetical protein